MHNVMNGIFSHLWDKILVFYCAQLSKKIMIFDKSGFRFIKLMALEPSEDKN